MPVCPFANLPEARAGRWGDGLTAAKMKDCRWLKPVLVRQFEFVEWTPDDHPRTPGLTNLAIDNQLQLAHSLVSEQFRPPADDLN